MLVRLFCHPDMAPLGLFTKEFVNLVVIDLGMEVRLLPPPPNFLDLEGLDVHWKPYQSLFNTPVTGPYVNVVSSNDPDEWTKLWTTNVTNLLVTTEPPPVLDTQHILRQGAYQAVIMPTSETGEVYAAWHAFSENVNNMAAIVLPVPWTLEHTQAIRDLILV